MPDVTAKPKPTPPATSVGKSTRTARAECSTKVIDMAANVLK